MAKAEIHKLPLGGCNCYLVKQEGIILVDTGFPNQKENFRRMMKNLSVAPEDISLILLTHGHWDHIGSAADLKRMTGGKVAINYREKTWVENALKELPTGLGIWGMVLALLMRVMTPMVKFPPCKVDLALDDEEFSLRPFGIKGKVLHTPGHSSGSMSIVLDSGDAFVGDLAMNGLPMRIGPGIPSVGEDTTAIRNSYRLLLESGARTIHPAHGNSFSADILKKSL